MTRFFRILPIVTVVILLLDSNEAAFAGSGIGKYCFSNPDTVPVNQFLYNGRIWRNKYFYIKGDPYLFAPAMLDGSVKVNNKSFNNVRIQYDIYSDELLSLNNHNVIIQLNKEIVDEFTISYAGTEYHFRRIDDNGQGPPTGYVNILYDGETTLLVKYFKTIELRAVENKYDSFSGAHKIYVKKDGKPVFIRNRKQLLDLFDDKKREIKTYLRENSLKVSGKLPASFIPVVEYYDRLTHQKN